MEYYRMYTSFSVDEKWDKTDRTILPHLQALYISGMAWAAEHETDGLLPRTIGRFAPYWLMDAMHEHVSLQSWSLDELANELCYVGVWETLGEEGYKIVGWLKRNVSVDLLNRRRQAARKGGKRSAEKRNENKKSEAHASSGASTELRVKRLRVKEQKLELTEGSAASVARPSAVEQVWKHYLSSKLVQKSGAKLLTPKRKKMLQARLKEGFTVKNLIAAIDGVQKDPWRMEPGEQTRRKFEVLFRDAGQIETFEAMNEQPPTSRRSKNPDDRHFDEVVAEYERKKKKRDQWNND